MDNLEEEVTEPSVNEQTHKDTAGVDREPVVESTESEQPATENHSHDTTPEHVKYQQLHKEACAERDRLAAEVASLKKAQEEKDKSFQEVTNKLEEKLLSKQEKLDTIEQQKDGVVGKLSLLESERLKLVNELTTAETKLMEATKENERSGAAAKKLKNECTRLQSSLDKAGKQSADATKLKEENGSLAIKVKWAQNKLKAETDAHKETKAQLAVTSKKLKEAREEGEQIRTDLKTMIQQYQESEEFRSNSLGLKLEKTEKELKQHEQEIADQQELHELTVKELELVKASYKIAQQEVSQHKIKLSDVTSRISSQNSEIEELKATLEKLRTEQNILSSKKTEFEKLSQTMEGDKTKFTALREAFTSLQKTSQHLEREVSRRKEREEELLSFSEKLSSANAEMKAVNLDNETKLSGLSSECESLHEQLRVSRGQEAVLRQQLAELTESSHFELERLNEQLNNKSKAVEELTIVLEDEKELAKASKKKNASSLRDLQRQLQQSKRRIDHLEATLQAEREAPATLPVNEGSRASSQNSLNDLVSHNHTVGASMGPQTQPPGTTSDDEQRIGSQSPELLFQNMDQEKLLLVDKLCRNKAELARLEEKIEFFEEHISQLTEDIQGKSKIIQSFILREQSGALAPAAYDEHRARHSKKTGVMATVFTGGKGHYTEMTYDLSLEINRKMQSILEDTLLKNITLKESIDTLGSEIQRLSAQVQAYETSRRAR